MPHRMKVMSLVQAVTKPLVQKPIHHPLLIDQVGHVQRTAGPRMKLLHFDHARVVVHL